MYTGAANDDPGKRRPLASSETVAGIIDFVREQRGKFEDRGEHTLKGVGEPMRVWVVREG